MNPIRYPDRYRCSVSTVAVTEPRLLLDRMDAWSDVGDVARRYMLPIQLGDPAKDGKLLDEASPLKRAAELRVPVLLAMGAEDRRVPLPHGTKMRDALTAAGNPPEWLLYAGEGHGWRKPENRFDHASKVEVFLARHLKP